MRVNWRDMETEELGSVYEALLELTTARRSGSAVFLLCRRGRDQRQRAQDARAATIRQTAWSSCCLTERSDQVIDRTVNENSGRAVDALLELSVIDPACGSGHFLLAAGRRLATRVAQLRSPGAPSAEDWRHALREVARRCLSASTAIPWQWSCARRRYGSRAWIPASR